MDKVIPVTDRRGPYGCKMSRLPHHLHNRLTNGGEALSFMRRPPFTLRKIADTHFCQRGWADPRGILRLEELGQLKNPMNSSGTEPAILGLESFSRTVNVTHLPWPRLTESVPEFSQSCQQWLQYLLWFTPSTNTQLRIHKLLWEQDTSSPATDCDC
jgi:hypothetical protein